MPGKLTSKEDIKCIVVLCKEGKSSRQIAGILGLEDTTIRDIIKKFVVMLQPSLNCPYTALIKNIRMLSLDFLGCKPWIGFDLIVDQANGAQKMSLRPVRAQSVLG